MSKTQPAFLVRLAMENGSRLHLPESTFFQKSTRTHAAAKDAKDTLEGSKVLNNTLQGINISHLRKRKIIFKMPFWKDMLVPWRV